MKCDMKLYWWFCLILFEFQTCFSYLNVYLCQKEVMRLLGLNAELYYVREGQVNNYALNFVIPVPATIEDLHFTWQSLAGKPLPYSIKIDVSNHAVLGRPILNISESGFVPVNPQTWRIELPCLGDVMAEVGVVIDVTVNTDSSATSLIFRRKKICLKPRIHSKQPIRIEPIPHASTSAEIFYAGAGSALGVLLLATIAVAACRLQSLKTRRDVNESEPQDERAFLSNPSYKSASSYANYKRPASLGDDRARDLQERIAELTIQRCRVRLRCVALEGTFGRVYRGTYSDEDGREKDVFVKTVTEHASQAQVSLLLREGCAMYGLKHERVLSILGVSIEDHTAPFLLYPDRGMKNMKKFLRECKANGEGAPQAVTTQDVVRMALQVVDAIQYLHKKNIIHKDIATRNCVVDEMLGVQLTDNALSRDLFPADYHCLGDNENRPIKWLAIESLTRREFSIESDVWTTGVLLWELTTLAQQPYAEIDPFDVASYLRDGYRLAQPMNCPDELFAVMAYCWAMAPEDRPTLGQLHVFLKDFYSQLTRYV